MLIAVYVSICAYICGGVLHTYDAINLVCLSSAGLPFILYTYVYILLSFVNSQRIHQEVYQIGKVSTNAHAARQSQHKHTHILVFFIRLLSLYMFMYIYICIEQNILWTLEIYKNTIYMTTHSHGMLIIGIVLYTIA